MEAIASLGYAEIGSDGKLIALLGESEKVG